MHHHSGINRKRQTALARLRSDSGHVKRSAVLVPKELQTFKGAWRATILHDRRLTPSSIVIGCLYADRITLPKTVANWRKTADIEIWGSQEELAEFTRFKPATVRRFFAQMRKHGYLKQVARGNQVRGSSRYQVMIPHRRETQ